MDVNQHRRLLYSTDVIWTLYNTKVMSVKKLGRTDHGRKTALCNITRT